VAHELARLVRTFRAALEAGIKTLVYASSDGVYSLGPKDRRFVGACLHRESRFAYGLFPVRSMRARGKRTPSIFTSGRRYG
jgi:hypothetical protein